LSARRVASRLLARAWAAPNTLLGVLVGLAMLCLGGRVRCVAGVVEFRGGLVGRLVAGLPGPVRFGAMTLGHVIVGIDAATLRTLRAHEHVHVRQYERWGPFFLPAYALSSAWEAARGRSGYAGNRFERQAIAVETTRRTRPDSRCGGPHSAAPGRRGVTRSSGQVPMRRRDGTLRQALDGMPGAAQIGSARHR